MIGKNPEEYVKKRQKLKKIREKPREPWKIRKNTRESKIFWADSQESEWIWENPKVNQANTKRIWNNSREFDQFLKNLRESGRIRENTKNPRESKWFGDNLRASEKNLREFGKNPREYEKIQEVRKKS